MKRIIFALIALLSAIGGFLIGFLIRQPKINKLKKHIEKLQKEIGRLQHDNQKYHDDFQNALLHLKSLKAINNIKRKKAKENAAGILIFQYGMKDYLLLLLHMLKTGAKVETIDIRFFNTFDKVIEGKVISDKDKEIIRDYIISRHKTEIENLQECDCSVIINEIETYKRFA